MIVAALKSAAGLSKPHIRPPHHVLHAALELGHSLRVLGVLQRHLGDGTDATAQLERALKVTQLRMSSERLFEQCILSSLLNASCVHDAAGLRIVPLPERVIKVSSLFLCRYSGRVLQQTTRKKPQQHPAASQRSSGVVSKMRSRQ